MWELISDWNRKQGHYELRKWRRDRYWRLQEREEHVKWLPRREERQISWEVRVGLHGRVKSHLKFGVMKKSVSLGMGYFSIMFHCSGAKWGVRGDLYLTRLGVLPSKFKGEVQGIWKCGNMVLIQWGPCQQTHSRSLGCSTQPTRNHLWFLPFFILYTVPSADPTIISIWNLSPFLTLHGHHFGLLTCLLVPVSWQPNWSPCLNYYYSAICPLHSSHTVSFQHLNQII